MAFWHMSQRIIKREDRGRRATSHRSSCSTRSYLPPLSLALLCCRVLLTILLIHPPTPSRGAPCCLPLESSYRGLPFDPNSRSGGSISRPGMASLAENMPGCGVPLRRSMDPGEPMPIRFSRSATVTGVGIAVVASPKRAFMSSRRTLAVSGYRKYTVMRVRFDSCEKCVSAHLLRS